MMISKLKTARKMSQLGITTHIANVAEDAVLLRIIQEETLGTVILPGQKKSNIKRWIAANVSKQNGSITVNTCLAEKLQDPNQIISILPVGIEDCQGDFKKGDLVEIISTIGAIIGAGLARYDATRLKNYLGQKNKPKFIHYDYLHVL